MANPYPIPREARATGVLSGDGSASYGPFGFKIFDTTDVEVITKPEGAEGFSTVAVTVAKVSGAALDHFTITFPAALPATTKFQVRGRRIHERSAGVTSGTQLSPDAMERELSKQAATLEELRRDAPDIDPDIEDGQSIIRKDGRMVGGPSASVIEAIPGLAAEVASDRLAIAADRVAVAADRMQTDLNVIQTGIDRAAVRGYEQNAANLAKFSGAPDGYSLPTPVPSEGSFFKLIVPGAGLLGYTVVGGAWVFDSAIGDLRFNTSPELKYFDKSVGAVGTVVIGGGWTYQRVDDATVDPQFSTAAGEKFKVLPMSGKILFPAFVPAANPTSDDIALMQKACDATPVGGEFLLGTGYEYRQSAKLRVKHSMTVDGGWNRLLLDAPSFPNNRHIEIQPDEPWANGGSRVPTTYQWTQTIGLGERTFNFVNTFNIGDRVAIHLGTDPHDPMEGHYVRVVRVIASDGLSFTTDAITPYPINGTTHRVIKVNNPVHGVTLKNLHLDYVSGTVPDTHIVAGFCSGIKVQGVKTEKARILFNFHNMYDFKVESVDAIVERKGNSSHGRIAACHNAEDGSFENIEGFSEDRGSWFFYENWCRTVKHKNMRLIDNDPDTTAPHLFVTGGAKGINFKGLTYGGASNTSLIDHGGLGASVEYSIEGLEMLKKPKGARLDNVESFADRESGVSFMKPGQYVQAQVSGTLAASATQIEDICSGVLRRMMIKVENTTGLSVYVRNSNGAILAVQSQLTAGQWSEVSAGRDYGTLFGVNDAAYPDKDVRFDTTGSFPGPSEFSIWVEYWPIAGSANTFPTA
ncbi:MAG: hypothetical protein CMH13_11280 [Martelella sp.]|uniref:hypothetical protein n=1 Tax=Martelella sp. TaxID=1969699 RepID=UPI000C4D419C|nr:hypothetical protein [Martelella sp.]MAU21102.1 hypothetical protein [Martelella sp.]